MFVIESYYSGENVIAAGELDGHKIALHGSASARGAEVKIDDVDYWWCGEYEKDEKNPDWVGQLERRVDQLAEFAWNQCNNDGVDPDGPWRAEFEDDTCTVTQIADPD